VQLPQTPKSTPLPIGAAPGARLGIASRNAGVTPCAGDTASDPASDHAVGAAADLLLAHDAEGALGDGETVGGIASQGQGGVDPYQHQGSKDENFVSAEDAKRRRKRGRAIPYLPPSTWERGDRSYWDDDNGGKDDDDLQPNVKDLVDAGFIEERACLTINPDKGFRIFWEVVGILVIGWVTLSLPFKLAFLSEELNNRDPAFVFQLFVDMFFIIDVILNFYTGYRDENERLILDGRAIRRHYLHGWFFIDFVGAIPFDYIIFIFWGQYYTALQGTKALRILKLVRLLRLLKITNLYRFFGRLEERLSQNTVRVFKLILSLLLWLHFDACMYFLVARQHQLDDGSFAEDSWVTANNLQDRPHLEQYLFSLWIVQSHMLSVTYGPTNPVRIEEVICTMLSMMAGAALYAGIIGTTASIIQNSDPSGAEFYRQWDELKAFMKYKEVPAELRDRLRKFFNARWKGRKVFDSKAIMSSLPAPYVRSLLMHECQWLLRSVPLLAHAKEGFMNAVVPLLESCTVMAGETVIQQLEPPSVCRYFSSFHLLTWRLSHFMDVTVSYAYHARHVSLFVVQCWWLISRGVVGIYRDGFRIGELRGGLFFGEASLVWGINSPVSIQTETVCEFYYLNRTAYEDLFGSYPELVTKMKKDSYNQAKHLGLADIVRRGASRSQHSSSVTKIPFNFDAADREFEAEKATDADQDVIQVGISVGSTGNPASPEKRPYGNHLLRDPDDDEGAITLESIALNPFGALRKGIGKAGDILRSGQIGEMLGVEMPQLSQQASLPGVGAISARSSEIPNARERVVSMSIPPDSQPLSAGGTGLRTEMAAGHSVESQGTVGSPRARFSTAFQRMSSPMGLTSRIVGDTAITRGFKKFGHGMENVIRDPKKALRQAGKVARKVAEGTTKIGHGAGTLVLKAAEGTSRLGQGIIGEAYTIVTRGDVAPMPGLSFEMGASTPAEPVLDDVDALYAPVVPARLAKRLQQHLQNSALENQSLFSKPTSRARRNSIASFASSPLASVDTSARDVDLPDTDANEEHVKRMESEQNRLLGRFTRRLLPFKGGDEAFAADPASFQPRTPGAIDEWSVLSEAELGSDVVFPARGAARARAGTATGPKSVRLKRADSVVISKTVQTRLQQRSMPARAATLSMRLRSQSLLFPSASVVNDFVPDFACPSESGADLDHPASPSTDGLDEFGPSSSFDTLEVDACPTGIASDRDEDLNVTDNSVLSEPAVPSLSKTDPFRRVAASSCTSPILEGIEEGCQGDGSGNGGINTIRDASEAANDDMSIVDAGYLEVPDNKDESVVPDVPDHVEGTTQTNDDCAQSENTCVRVQPPSDATATLTSSVSPSFISDDLASREQA
jgi:hypothetical protein